MFFSRKKKKDTRKQRDISLEEKMLTSQIALIEAAAATAEAARDITTTLQGRLEDSITQIEGTARLINDALFLCDTNGKILTSNPSAKRMFGDVGATVHGLFELDGETIGDVHTLWDVIENTKIWLPSSKRSLKGVRNNMPFWIEPAVSRLEWSNRSSSMLLLVRDVDDIVLLPSAVSEARQKYRSTFETSFDGTLIVHDGKIIAANPAARRLFGYSLEEMIGKPLEFMFLKRDHPLIIPCVEAVYIKVDGVHNNGTLLGVLFTAIDIKWQGLAAKLVSIKDLTLLPTAKN